MMFCLGNNDSAIVRSCNVVCKKDGKGSEEIHKSYVSGKLKEKDDENDVKTWLRRM